MARKRRDYLPKARIQRAKDMLFKLNIYKIAEVSIKVNAICRWEI